MPFKSNQFNFFGFPQLETSFSFFGCWHPIWCYLSKLWVLKDAGIQIYVEFVRINILFEKSQVPYCPLIWENRDCIKCFTTLKNCNHVTDEDTTNTENIGMRNWKW